MITAIAIDDEPLALNVIESFCEKIPYIKLLKTFDKTIEAQKYLEKYPIDLLFLDIHMPSLNGIDLYKQLNQNTLVIFCTAHSEYAIEGFDLNALDYLLKPFTFERFEKATKKAKEILNGNESQKGDCLFVRADYKLHKIKFSEILFIEALDDYMKINLTSKKILVARVTMKAMREKLPDEQFLRVHRSFIISIDKIDTISSKYISINEKQIPIGANYEDDLRGKLKFNL